MRTMGLKRLCATVLSVIPALFFVASGAMAAAPQDREDFFLAGSISRIESTRSVVIDPTEPNRILVAYQSDDECLVRRSADGGRTWHTSAPLVVPGPAIANCHDPVLAFTPDGRRLYAVYTRERDSETSVYLSFSTDGGTTWRAPVLVPPTPNGLGPVWCCGAAELVGYQLVVAQRPNGSYVLYLGARLYIGEYEYGLGFVRSPDGGSNWGRWRKLAFVNQDQTKHFSLASGPDGTVVMAWEDAGFCCVGSKIRLARSTDYGASFSAPIVAVREAYGTRAPDMAFDPNGDLHLVYTRYVSGPGDTYTAQIRATHSAGPPHAIWAAPQTVSVRSDSNDFQGLTSTMLAIEPCGASSVLHLAWVDGRRGSERGDLFYSRRLAHAGAAWSKPIRISDPTPPAVIPRFGFSLGGWSPTAFAAVGSRAIAVWTDGRFSVAPEDADVYGSRVVSGLVCH